jgi:hypothetical protein
MAGSAAARVVHDEVRNTKGALDLVNERGN